MKLTERVLILILLAVAISAVGVVAAIVSWSIKFSWRVIPPQTSSLVCYENDNSTLLRAIDWGVLEQGKTYTYSFTVKNNGTTTLTLHLNIPNDAWTKGSWGSLSWDREGYTLNAGEAVKATLTWQISSTAPTGTYTEALTIGVEGS
jgi:hypothetical protein